MGDKVKYNNDNCKLLNGDCIKVLDTIPECSVDLIVTSPPYDDLREYNSVIDYDALIPKLYKVLKDGGVVVWNVNDRVKDGTKTLSSFKQALMFKEKGFLVNDVMIWEKTNPIPQVKQPRYDQCFEYMFIFSKGRPKTFNPIMVRCSHAGEHSDSCKTLTPDVSRTKKDIIINDFKKDRNIWKFNVANNKTKHPAVFPIELPLRHIKTWTNENDVVLDPFMGSGTTGLASLSLNRSFIGIELDEEYFNISKERVNNLMIEKNSELWE